MTREVVTAESSTPVGEALERLRSKGVRHLPVVEGERLIGIVTERDLRLARAAKGADAKATVAEVMQRDPITTAPSTPIEEAGRLLYEHRIGCLPVVVDGRLVGILTESDLLRAFVELLAGRDRHSRVEILAPDRPGELARVVRLIGIDHGINITGLVVPPPVQDRALVIVHLEADDAAEVVTHLRRVGYDAGSPSIEGRPE